MKRMYLERLGVPYNGSPGRYKELSFFYRLKEWFHEFRYRRLRRKYGFETREIWNTDTEFFYWVYERVSLFLDDHGYVDLEDADTFDYEGRNLKETLELLKSIVEEYITTEDYPHCGDFRYEIREDGALVPVGEVSEETFHKKLDDIREKKEELYGKAFDIFRQVLPYMWW